MLEDLWNGILELTAQFVIPDWGALIALLPVFIFVLTIVILVWTFRPAVPGAEGPSRQGAGSSRGRRPGSTCRVPRSSPILASIGAVPAVPRHRLPGPAPGGRRDRAGPEPALLARQSRCGSTTTTSASRRGPDLPVVVHDGPPPGVHLPGPSFRPFLGAVGHRRC